jgi:phospho-N-acetylmuramoyl-pentapeptide-transferase
MLVSLAAWLQSMSPEYGFFRVVQYLTFRAVMAAMTALLIGLVMGPWVIRRLAELKIGQPIRGYGMETHLSKSGTPTMGGVLVLLSITISTLLWFDWTNRFVWIVLAVTLGFGAIGWADDWRKVVRKDPEGMRSREKYLWQSLIGLLAALYLVFSILGELQLARARAVLQVGRLGLRRQPAAEGRPDAALLQGSELSRSACSAS